MGKNSINDIKPDLSIIIVSFNTKRLLADCLDSIFKSLIRPYKLEVIVYDNGSTDGSVEVVRRDYPQVKLLAGKDNIGYAAANNRGLEISQGKIILLLNSDTRLNDDTLKKMLDFMYRNQHAAVATCKLVLSDGQLDPACHRGFPTPWAALTYFLKLERLFPHSRFFGQYHMGYLDFATTHEIDSPSGAFYMVRSNVIHAVGNLDEDYFMYAEDLDLSYRIKHQGYRIYYYPETTCLHLKKQSGRRKNDGDVQFRTDIMFHENNWLFYQKHFAPIYPQFLTLAIKFTYWLRLLLLKRFRI